MHAGPSTSVMNEQASERSILKAESKMKYIRKEIIETIIADEEIKEASVILDILDSARKNKQDISIAYTKGSGYAPQTFTQARARVEFVHRDKGTIDITVIQGSSYSVKISALPIGSILKVEMTVNSSDQFAKRDNVTRTDMLDVSDENHIEKAPVNSAATPRQLVDD